MTPLEEYNRIVNNRKHNPVSQDVYTERHHIIPKSLGGGNDDENIVRLLSKEHYRCHRLLVDIHSTGDEHWKMLCAWNMMANMHGVHVSEEEYGNLKRQYSESCKGRKKSEETRRKMSIAQQNMPQEVKDKISNTLKGHAPYEGHDLPEYRAKISESLKMAYKTGKRKSWNKGKTGCFTEETLEKIREAGRNRVFTEETRQKISQANLGKHHSEETKKKLSLASKGRVLTEEHKHKISEGVKKSITPERCKRHSEALKGHVVTEETRRKISETKRRKFLEKKLAEGITLPGGGNISKEIGAEGKEELEKLEEKIKTDRSKGQGWAFV